MSKAIASQILRASLYLAALAVALAALPVAARDGNFNANDCMEVRCETNSVVNRCDNPVNYAYCKIKPGQRGCLYEFSRRIEPGQSGLSLCQSEHQYAFTACLAPHKPVSVSPTQRQCIPDPSDPAVKKIGEPCDSEWESNIPGLVCDGEWTYVVPPDESPASAAQTLTADEQEWKKQQEAEKAEAEERAREKECSQILNSCETACNDICEDPATCDPGTDATDCGYEKDEAAALRAEHRRARQEEREKQEQREEPEVAVADGNACDFANDGSCDEPHLCKPGTDTDDCLAEEMGDTCHFANDGKCDEPEPCPKGTDTSDCTQIQGGQTKTEQLLKTDLNPFATDENGWTHMHWAAAANDGEAIRRLIELGGSVDPIDHGDDSEFSTAGHRRAALLGLKLGEWKNTGDTPLFVAAELDRGTAASVLIANGADVNVKINSGSTPLHSAAYGNAVNVARILLESGAETNVKSDYGNMPLHRAVWNNASDVARLLLENGAEVNAKNDNGNTPLHRAAWNNASETAVLLLENGAKINAKNNKGRTPVDFAIYKKHAEMQSFLRRNGGRCNNFC